MPGKIQRLNAVLKELSSKMVVAGWVDENGSASNAFVDMLLRKATGETSPSLKVEPSNALIARTLNYGREPGMTSEGRAFGRIPARPFMTMAREIFSNEKDALFKRFLPSVLNGRMSADDFLKLLGERIQSCIIRAMREGEYEPIAESTLKHRRVSKNPKPLIDTGHLINSVSFEIRNA